MINVSPGLVGNWASGRAIPSYQNVLKLIKLGMTASELFGTESAEMLNKNEQDLHPAQNLSVDDLRSTIRDIMLEFGAEAVAKHK